MPNMLDILASSFHRRRSMIKIQNFVSIIPQGVMCVVSYDKLIGNNYFQRYEPK